MRNTAVAFLLFSIFIAGKAGASDPIRIFVDAREAPRRIFHARLIIPAKAGELTLAYPRWIPGEHAPANHVANLAGLKILSGSKAIEWHRDSVNLDLVRCSVPAEAESVEVDLDALGVEEWAVNGTSQTLNLNWNAVLLYPYGSPADDISFAASLQIPPGWKYATALQPVRESEGNINFETVSLTTLIDSPVIAGAHLRAFPLSDRVELDVVAESESALDPGALLDHYKKLVVETEALFGVRHYRHYRLLLTLSDYAISNGLEHHESSDNRLPEDAFTNDSLKLRWAHLLPHEFFHSWNGKYRRPAGLATRDYQEPMQTELLWVYEGLTSYYGYVLAARSGIMSPEEFRENAAWLAAIMDLRSGRAWRSLQDNTISAPALNDAPEAWTDYRRGLDYYREGPLIWLEADVLIRKQTGGRKSLDDFCRAFFGGAADTTPAVVTFTLDDVIRALNDVAAYDWKSFFQQRMNTLTPRVPLAGVEGSGWRLVYNEKPNSLVEAREKTLKLVDLMYSIGLMVKEEGTISDVKEDGASAKAGLAPGMKVVAVNGRRWTPDLLRSAIKQGAPDLLVENRDYFATYHVEVHDGLKYPHLVPASGVEDMLPKILAPHK